MVWLGYILFVVYGSLVPLRFTPHSLGEAWNIFQHLPFLRLGVESRADWVANGVLYLPVGFLTAVVLADGTVGRAGRWMSSGLALVFGAALATTVEFSQIFFPPRSVILNDLLAEALGTLLGVAGALAFSGWFQKFVASLGAVLEGQKARLLAQAYIAGYLFFALFPFDFLVSWAEIERKANSAMWGWWVADHSGGNFLFLLRLMIDVILAIPIGWALVARASRQGLPLATAACVGLVLGAGIELAQFFVASGISQGVSVLTRALGVVIGAATWGSRDELVARLRSTPAYFKTSLSLLYGAILLTVNGGGSEHWDTVGAAGRLADVNFLPFYYHYYTTEAKALYSLATVALMYAPLGALGWLAGRSARRTAIAGALVAAAIETGKLFLAGSHPDPTNLLIGAIASGLASMLIESFVGAARIGGVSAPTSTEPERGEGGEGGISQVAGRGEGRRRHRTRSHSDRRGLFVHLGASLAFVIVAWKLVSFPFLPLALGLGTVLAAVFVWRRPAAAFFIIPAVLPVLDLAPWSGRFFLDEFDLLLLALVPVAYLRASPGSSRRRMPDGALWTALALLTVSFAVSTAIGLGGIPNLNGNSFISYYSPENALRITKGFVWALLLIGLFRRLRAQGEDPRLELAWGMLLGLSLAVAVILWERLTFTGLFNFNADYRATGPFSALHVGGAYIEGFLSAAAPFLAALLMQKRAVWQRAAGLALLAATTYALMVTYSRNGYSAYGIALGVVFIFGFFSRELRWSRFVVAVVLGGAVLAAALPVYLGGFAQERMAHVGRDLGLRVAHWEDSLGMRDEGLSTTLFGMGVGRFPETAYWRSRGQKRSGAYRLEDEGGNVFLRLTPGESIYMEQFVALEPRTEYVLTALLRARSADARFTFPICQKWMLASYECVWKTVKIGESPETWQVHEIRFNSGILGSGPWYARRPVKLSLYNPNPGSSVDVDNVSLKPLGGDEVVSNGDFSRRLDRWFFSTDSHLQWHAKSLPVAVFFDQGLLGLTAWTLMIGLALWRLGRVAAAGDLLAAGVAGSIVAFVVVGLFDTVIDAPRFLMLLTVLAAMGAMRPLRAREKSRG